jgi:protocatechuate 3,4-dioxygenase beta subunit
MAAERDGVSRRDALGAFGLIAGSAALVRPGSLAATVVGLGGSGPAGDPFWPDCVVTPAQTEGPYFVDEMLERVDIRSDPVDGSIATGHPLRLHLSVHRVDGAACAPVTGAHVDIWQCDSSGVYAGVRDARGLFDTTGKKFLRGYQVSDAQGSVAFQTIYPGWYPGRTPHIHFKIRLFAGSQRTFEFTSQLYFDDAITDRIFATGPYAEQGERTTRNNRDGIFQREGGSQLMLRLREDGAQWIGEFSVGLRLT